MFVGLRTGLWFPVCNRLAKFPCRSFVSGGKNCGNLETTKLAVAAVVAVLFTSQVDPMV